ELIREAALEDVFDELPHSLAVVVNEMTERDGEPGEQAITDIYAEIYVERDSQKGIIIGKGGAQLRTIGQRSRKSIRRLLGTQVHLDLVVKVAKEWQRNPKHMNRLGFSTLGVRLKACIASRAPHVTVTTVYFLVPF